MQQEIIEQVAEQMLVMELEATPTPSLQELHRMNEGVGFRVDLADSPVTVSLLPDAFRQARQRFLDLFEAQPFPDEDGPDGRGAEPREWD